MERFTKFDGEEYIPACFDTCTEKDCDGCPKSNPNMWINEVGKYEDAEEKGLMVRLPCKVGDMVWVNDGYFGDLCSGSVFNIRIENEKLRIGIDAVSSLMGYEFTKFVNVDDFGKTVFLTKEEAE